MVLQEEWGTEYQDQSTSRQLSYVVAFVLRLKVQSSRTLELLGLRNQALRLLCVFGFPAKGLSVWGFVGS